MAKFQKLNQGLDRMIDRLNDLESQGVDIQAMRNTPEAKARQAVMARKLAASENRAAGRREDAKTAAVAHAAATYAAGDVVVTRRGQRGEVVAIDGGNLVLNIAGASRTFAASMVRKA